MQIGVFTPVFAKLSFEEMLREVATYKGITAVELGTGCWPGSNHVDMPALLASKDAASTFRARVRDAGLTISALSCHGNPVHPEETVAREHDGVFKQTIRLAEALEVPVVVTFSGCPGGSPEDKTPNWVTAAWPPEFADALAWQWEKKLIPYWQEAAKIASDAGVKVALEAHPGFCVYNPETMLRLREAAGPSIGMNFDPSHLWWQGVDIPTAIAALGDAIFHFHAKDVALNPGMIARNGVLDTKSYSQMQQRSWLFRSVGWGHGELDWKRIASALRLIGYDYVMSIEHEDALASIREGLTAAVEMLSRVVLREPAVEPWWT
jgi:sugar phosphate isomerase/epimerase